MIKIAPRLALVSSAALLCVSLLGCEDPAANVPPASVNSAKPVASAKPTAAATTTAAATAAGTATAAPSASAAAVALPEKPAGAITIAPPQSKIEFTGSKVSGKHDGSFQQFDGWIALADEKPETAKIAVAIDMTSVKSDDEKLTGHLKSPDFFDVEKNPKATFVSTEIKPGGEKGATHTITGNLNLRGVEKSVTFPATIKVAADKVTAKSEFSINRKDWNIVYAGKADDLIRDGVVIKLDLSADRPKK